MCRLQVKISLTLLKKSYNSTSSKQYRRIKLPNHKSALKRMRQNEKRRVRNKSIRTNTKTSIKKVLSAIEEKNAESAELLFREATKVIFKAKSKGVYHKKNASRKVLRLAKKVNKLKAELSESA